ncbi:SXL [Symbiodinium sp. CCMP2456]|nr:SXL [Symbiodinium sp. CCMP2456]
MGGPMTQTPSDELFVSGLPTDATDDLLKKIFSQYGSIKEVKVLPVAAGKQAAAAFVDMNSLEDAKWIVENVNGNVPQGMAGPVTVAYATPRSRRKGMKGGMKGMPPMMEMMAAMMASMSVGAPVAAKGWSSGGKGWSDSGAKGWGTSGKGWGDSGGAGKGWGASSPVSGKGWGDASGGWGSGATKGFGDGGWGGGKGWW